MRNSATFLVEVASSLDIDFLRVRAVMMEKHLKTCADLAAPPPPDKLADKSIARLMALACLCYSGSPRVTVDTARQRG